MKRGKKGGAFRKRLLMRESSITCADHSRVTRHPTVILLHVFALQPNWFSERSRAECQKLRLPLTARISETLFKWVPCLYLQNTEAHYSPPALCHHFTSLNMLTFINRPTESRHSVPELVLSAWRGAYPNSFQPSDVFVLIPQCRRSQIRSQCSALISFLFPG